MYTYLQPSRMMNFHHTTTSPTLLSQPSHHSQHTELMIRQSEFPNINSLIYPLPSTRPSISVNFHSSHMNCPSYNRCISTALSTISSSISYKYNILQLKRASLFLLLIWSWQKLRMWVDMMQDHHYNKSRTRRRRYGVFCRGKVSKTNKGGLIGLGGRGVSSVTEGNSLGYVW